ncbi:DUF2523 domain-containing protein [Nitrosomonas sp. Nm166]|uniref:DUF2523 domain-containing protein n=1 Tax=Nitrosomonas sp. Nm166 TaxID=1881054 RepID=UPI0008E1F008|nr:DUF2523 domain-containing protein [Nitrosomonas sp. Nm166]SFF12752.1 Protein of unknown function [Nitrosomonas sp. Nm166]
MNILAPLGEFLDRVIGPLAKRVLSSLGLGYLSYQAVTLIMEQAIQFAKEHYLGLPSAVLGLAGLAGIGEGLGIISAAMLFRVGFNAQRKVIGVLNK